MGHFFLIICSVRYPGPNPKFRIRIQKPFLPSQLFPFQAQALTPSLWPLSSTPQLPAVTPSTSSLSQSDTENLKVKKKEKNVRRTILNNVVGTLDLSIRQFVKGKHILRSLIQLQLPHQKMRGC